MTTEPDTRALASVYRTELTARIARALPNNGAVTPLEGLSFYRASSTRGPIHTVTLPSLCVIAQGVKEVYLGEKTYCYDPSSYLLTTVELPVIGQLTEATPERPYLALRLVLDPALIASVMLDAGLPAPRREGGSLRGLEVSPLGTSLLETTLRLVRLAEADPAEVRVLLPLVTREIVFRLLQGEQSARLRQIAVLGGHVERIAHAIGLLRKNFDTQLRIEQLAKEIGMSPSVFHEHFKAVTALSPLQFQKHLRLQEARRLLLNEDIDAASAGHRVGYEDASQFSKEYKRLFGNPPMRDIEQLRAMR